MGTTSPGQGKEREQRVQDTKLRVLGFFFVQLLMAQSMQHASVPDRRLGTFLELTQQEFTWVEAPLCASNGVQEPE